MPLPITKGAASAQGFGAFTSIGGSNDLHWISLLSSSTETLTPYSIAVDATGNIYCGGYTSNSGFTVLYLGKYNTSGTFQWQRQIGNSSTQNYNGTVTTDSYKNSYLCGYSNVSSTTNLVLSKRDGSGSLLWQIKLVGASGSGRMGIDGSANVYLSGFSSPSYLQIAKYDSAGSILWQRRLTSGAASGTAVDSSGNMYIAGVDNTGATKALTMKINSSATILWQRRIASGSNLTYANSVSFDSSGNVYSCGYWEDSGTSKRYGFVVKYSSTGVLQWQRALSSTGDIILYSSAVDSSGNVYIGGTANGNGCVLKYNSSGALQWQRSISPGINAISLTTDSKNNIYVSIDAYDYTKGYSGINVWKLPSDGSLLGTYTVGGVSFTYAASALVDTAGSLTDSAASLTSSVSTLTSTTTTFATSTPTAVSSTTQI